MIYVGLDVSLNSVAVCAVDETGKLIREGTTLADAELWRNLGDDGVRKAAYRGG
ncbi:hypothetical protein ACVI1J_000108 [Bradyrhizobium diazoefficiens]